MADDAWVDLLLDSRDELVVGQMVDLRQSDRSQMPMTLGFFQPAILLPESSDSYAWPRRRAVLLHELAHVRRCDCWTQLISQISCALYWWHPLAWIAARHMRFLSERASDDLVLDAGATPAEYAHDLLDMARGLVSERATVLASVTMAHRSRFEERLLAILDKRLARRKLTVRAALGTAAAGLFLVMARRERGGSAVRSLKGHVIPSEEPSIPWKYNSCCNSRDETLARKQCILYEALTGSPRRPFVTEAEARSPVIVGSLGSSIKASPISIRASPMFRSRAGGSFLRQRGSTRTATSIARGRRRASLPRANSSGRYAPTIITRLPSTRTPDTPADRSSPRPTTEVRPETSVEASVTQAPGRHGELLEENVCCTEAPGWATLCQAACSSRLNQSALPGTYA